MQTVAGSEVKMAGPAVGRRDALRSCLGRFATGVTVVSFRGPSGARGITVNSFTAVSLEPPLVLVSVARTARSHDLLRGRPFCVNVLGAEQEAIARQFAGADAGPAVWVEENQAPRIAGALAHVECRPWRDHECGDHTLFIGEVLEFRYRDGDALGFHTSRFVTIPDTQLGIERLI